MAIELDMEINTFDAVDAHLKTIQAYKRAIEALKEQSND